MAEDLKLLVSICALILSAVALLVSWRAMRSGRETRTSDFQAVEEVKSKTAELLAAMRSAMVKGALATQGEKVVDFAAEKKVAAAFAASTTGFAYYAWTAQKSEGARHARKSGEPWRLFWIHLARFSRADSPIELGTIAARIEVLFDGMSANDIRSIAVRMADLPNAVAAIIASRSHDVLIGPFIEVFVHRPTRQREQFPEMLAYLKSLGIADPDIDLMLASINGDTELLQQAIQRGASVTVTDTEIMRRYAEQLKNFRPSKDKAT